MLCQRCDNLGLDSLEKRYGEYTTEDGKHVLNFRAIEDFSSAFDDDAPGFPELAAAAQTGCELCSLLRTELATSCLGGYDGQVHFHFQYQLDRPFDPRRPEPQYPGALVVDVTTKDPSQPGLGVSYILSLHSDDENIKQWLRLDIPKPEKDVLSQKSLAFIEESLQGPLRYEPDPNPEFRPTRLLDLGEEDAISGIRLVIPQGHEPLFKYAALSYCWGPPEDAKKQSTTTSESLHERLQHIQEEDLSPVILDTVKLCRALKIRYLWVDALCIIQGDGRDWETESGRMGSIYRNSFVTICALGSSSCLKGYLSRRLPSVDMSYRTSPSASPASGTYTMVLRGEAPLAVRREMVESGTRCDNIFQDLDITVASWLTRGWTFQEHHLSTRRIFIGRASTHFSDNGYDGTMTYSEDGTHTVGPGLGISFMLTRDSWRDQIFPGIAHFWHKAIYEYRLRNLTRETDSLPALSGLAQSIADMTGARYLAGLWDDEIQTGLTWRGMIDTADKDNDPRRPSFSHLLDDLRANYLAPSWSPLAFRGNRNDFLPWASCWNSNDCDIKFEVLDASVDVVNEDRNPYGIVRSGFLKLRGSFVSLSGVDFVREKSNGNSLVNWVARRRSDNAYVADASLDFTPAKEHGNY
ncbi:hypothetical protein ACJ41O_009984 [Fusarium nematophilum]